MTYTEQQIRDMKPGPDMDILLEVELFGKVRGGVGRLGLVGDGRYFSYPQQLSRTWEGMGRVVEEMQRRGWSFQMQSRPEGYFMAFHDGTDTYVAYASSAPHAVAMAALLALRGGESDE